LRNILALAVLAAASLSAAVVTPLDAGGPYCDSPPFGLAACSITSEYSSVGLIFKDTAVFDDPPRAWGGINGLGEVDLLTPVLFHLVVPSTAILGTVDSITVEAGFADDGSLTLEAYDIMGGLLGSALNGPPEGPFGRTTMSLSILGMHSFKVGGGDTFGVNSIEFGTITPAGAVPEPSTWAMIAGALLALSHLRRKS